MSYLPYVWKVEWEQCTPVDWIKVSIPNSRKVIEYKARQCKGQNVLCITIKISMLVQIEKHIIRIISHLKILTKPEKMFKFLLCSSLTENSFKKKNYIKISMFSLPLSKHIPPEHRQSWFSTVSSLLWLSAILNLIQSLFVFIVLFSNTFLFFFVKCVSCCFFKFFLSLMHSLSVQSFPSLLSSCVPKYQLPFSDC